MKSEPGKIVNHAAPSAPNEADAAQYYPAIYWYSMLKIPAVGEFAGSNPDMPKNISPRWLNQMKNNGCIGCHQLGQLSTRTIPKAFGEFANHEEAWVRRVSSGQAGENMVNQLAGDFNSQPIKIFRQNWTRLASPMASCRHSRPERPQGVERNIVVTLRDWMNERQYLHDLIASDRRYPTVNANGPLYGSPEYSSDDMPILDPVKNTATAFRLTTTPDTPEGLGPGHAAAKEPMLASAYWGEQKIWDTRANNHNSMLDRQGRVWLAATGHGPNNPDWCKKGGDHPSAKVFPIERTNRRVTMFDPKTQKYTAYLTCFGSASPAVRLRHQ